MDAARTPSGQRDMGDDTYGNSILEAARYVLDSCVRQTSRGGWVKRFSESPAIALMAVKHIPYRLCHALHRAVGSCATWLGFGGLMELRLC